ncbi:MAG: hypothetical protein M3Q48_16000, partial [Actinomycetota bacterium]|nr:hypothetical protein [Actinomycetota bacterium]
MGVLATLALIGGVAWACVPQARVTATPKSGAVGTEVTLSGTSFDASGGPVKVWWDGSGGRLLGTATVKADRTFSFSFKVPDGASGGSHVVATTQSDANGQPIAGSPVNTTFRVDGAAPAQPARSDLQGEPDNSVVEPAPAPDSVATPAPARSANRPA